MQILCSAQKQHGILEQENRTEQGTGQGGATGTGQNGMALHYDMGMLAETQRKGQNAEITGLHPEPHLPKGQKHKTLHTRGRRNTNGGRAGKGICGFPIGRGMTKRAAPKAILLIQPQNEKTNAIISSSFLPNVG